MTFPMSLRFSYDELEVHPVKNNSTLSKAFGENDTSLLGKSFNRSKNLRRHSLIPSKNPRKNSSSSEESDNKDISGFKSRLSIRYSENKENQPSPPKSGNSNIPRIKKQAPEYIRNYKIQAPLLLTREQKIHSCFPFDQDYEITKNHFNRYSLGRMSLRPAKRLETSFIELEDSPTGENKDDSIKNRTPRRSYTVLPKVEENTQQDPAANTRKCQNNQTLPTNLSSLGAVPKRKINITDDMKTYNTKTEFLARRYQSKEIESKFDEESENIDCTNMSVSDDLMQKDLKLVKELSERSKVNQYYAIASENDENLSRLRDEDEKTVVNNINSFIEDHLDENCKVKSKNLSSLDDCNVIFLVNEEFIDDEYDSYIQSDRGRKGYMQVVQNQELYEMVKYLVRVYLQKDNKSKDWQKIKNVRHKLETNIGRKFGRFLNRRKTSKNVLARKNLWSEIGKIVRANIEELKNEYQEEIFNQTNKKIEGLITELKSVVIKANKDIEETCEKATQRLISQLENVALKN